VAFDRFFSSLKSFIASLLLPNGHVRTGKIRYHRRASSGKLRRFLQFCSRFVVHVFLEVCLRELRYHQHASGHRDVELVTFPPVPTLRMCTEKNGHILATEILTILFPPHKQRWIGELSKSTPGLTR
jgi:hypothetical protein